MPPIRNTRASRAQRQRSSSLSELSEPGEEGQEAERTSAQEFNRKVYEMVRQVPEGKVCSYGQIAKLISHPRHSRMVGTALKVLPRSLSSPYLLPPRPNPAAANVEADPLTGEDEQEEKEEDEEAVMPEPEPNPDWVPWHRIVSSSGVISPRGSTAAVARQADFLRAEGVEVREGPRNDGGGGGNGGAEQGGGVDAFGLGGAISGGRVSIAKYGWKGP
ncbi:hypothetical protein JCM11641_004931 [Rhodosporidiobolus odoratus]